MLCNPLPSPKWQRAGAYSEITHLYYYYHIYYILKIIIFQYLYLLCLNIFQYYARLSFSKGGGN